MTTDKKALALSLLASGKSPSDVATEVGVSRQTIHAWQRAGATPAPTPSSVEVDLLRLEVDHLRKQLDVYRRALAEAQH
jgi:hypothetical protein